jgi:hypothetical protein
VGGFGSGRHGRTVTAESTASYVLSISALKEALQKGRCLTGTIRFDEERLPETGFPVVVTIDLTKEWDCFVELIHLTRDEPGRDPIVTDRVQLAWTTPTYGGCRWWFLCPRTGRRTTNLFLPNGGWHFWSRQAYGLGYACQREDRFSRLQRRVAKLNRELGGLGWTTWQETPPKPKWVRWATYDRKVAQWKHAVIRARGELISGARRLLVRIERRDRISSTTRPNPCRPRNSATTSASLARR